VTADYMLLKLIQLFRERPVAGEEKPRPCSERGKVRPQRETLVQRTPHNGSYGLAGSATFQLDEKKP
jgi:hypothetical protein